MKVAIIGSGIAGLGAAYMLSPHYDVTVYEKNAYAGGHSRTIEVDTADGRLPVDTGFIVFNDWNYPHLTAFFEHLNVPYQKSDMSFGVSIDKAWLEYSSDCLFSKENITRGAYWGMLYDIIRFNLAAKRAKDLPLSVTLADFIKDKDTGDWFRRYYILAMGAAIWSCPVETIMKFPARTFIQFFKNHGLLNLHKRPQWYTVTGGSREYVKRIRAALKEDVRLNCGAASVVQNGQGGFAIKDMQGHEEVFDRVVFACHADEALALMDAPSAQEKEVLGAFSYQDNEVIVHTDDSFMPRNRKCWASWVYLNEGRRDEKPVVSLSYWMNNLQSLPTQTPVIITLNPARMPQDDKILDRHAFSHPVFNKGAIEAQGRIKDIQGQRGLWFCGAYQRYGFHEDGLLSAVNMVKSMGHKPQWEGA